MNDTKQYRQNSGEPNSKGRANKKEETTEESHKSNKGPKAEKVKGYSEDGRCKMDKDHNNSHKDDDDQL